jgi:hypothetical protein
VLITPTAKIFSDSRVKESHARMRNKSDNPPPETTQARPALRGIFDPCDWVQLTPAYGRLRSIVGPNNRNTYFNQLTATKFNWYVHEGLLTLGLVASDGTYRVPDAVERQKLTIRVPLNYEEGCSIEPYYEGCWYVWRYDLDRRTTIPSPAARVEAELAPEPAPAVEPTPPAEPRQPAPVPSSPQVEPKSPLEAEPIRRGHPEEYDWGEGIQFMRRELDKRGDPRNPINAVEGWRSDADVARSVAAHIALPNGRAPDFKHTARIIRPELKRWRAEQQSRN